MGTGAAVVFLVAAPIAIQECLLVDVWRLEDSCKDFRDLTRAALAKHPAWTKKNRNLASVSKANVALVLVLLLLSLCMA